MRLFNYDPSRALKSSRWNNLKLLSAVIQNVCIAINSFHTKQTNCRRNQTILDLNQGSIDPCLNYSKYKMRKTDWLLNRGSKNWYHQTEHSNSKGLFGVKLILIFIQKLAKYLLYIYRSWYVHQVCILCFPDLVIFLSEKGNCTQNGKLSMFCAYLKIVNTVLKNN